ncbi:MAG: zf-HC2 domain-containing protein [Actinomycetia bacterium]|nr:zf-HC2 domain-containing protein [Actinomycetes bacterium]
MADPTPLSHDELVSAYIDGELTTEEEARVEADPRLMAILRELTPVVTAVRAPVTRLGPDVLDDLIGRALDEGESGATSSTGATPAESMAPVVDLARRRARRNQILTRAGAVAAGVAVIALAGAALQGFGRADHDEATSADRGGDTAEFSIKAEDSASAEERGGTDAAEMAPQSGDADAAGDAAASSGGVDEEAETEAVAEADEDMAEADEGLLGDDPPAVPGLASDLGPTDQPTLEALVDDNLALLSGTPPVEPTPRCTSSALSGAGFEVVWWAEAGWEGDPAHVVAWRSATELLVTVYAGSGTDPDVSEECEPLFALAR